MQTQPFGVAIKKKEITVKARTHFKIFQIKKLKPNKLPLCIFYYNFQILLLLSGTNYWMLDIVHWMHIQQIPLCLRR